MFDARGVIYLIENWVTGRCYIGQTVKTFAERYGGLGLWWHYTHNKALNEDVDKYGSASFRMRILAHSKTLDELNRLEKAYAKQYNAYLPHGYNKQVCGISRKHMCGLDKVGTVELNDPTGKDVVISNPAEFCDINRINKQLFSLLISGKSAYHRGWTPKGVTRKVDPRIKSYVLFEENGTRHEITGLTKFCEERGLGCHDMRQMTSGITYVSQGYALSMEAFKKRKTRTIVTLTKDGRDLVIRNVQKECSKIGIKTWCVYELANGKLSSYDGWTLKSLENVPANKP